MELARQLADREVPLADWQTRIPALGAVLDPGAPSYRPNGKEIAWLVVTRVVELIASIKDESRYVRACWHHLLTVAPD